MAHHAHLRRGEAGGGQALSASTIVAIATAPGRAGIGVVRVSGPLAGHIAQAITGRTLKPRQAHYAPFRAADGAVLDQGIALYFAAPHSYTGEAILELQGHGGDAVLQLVLARCCELGARLAEPGEFSKRAFLNGKLDLAQAEAVADLIDATTAQAARSAMRSLSGVFSAKVREMAEVMVHLRMLIEASLDFPEEDIEALRPATLRKQVEVLRAQLESVLAHAKQGELLRSGLSVVLLGQPNVGKSSLLNRLAGQDLAIVTASAGTTRDAVRSQVQIQGIPLHLIDTAGLRETADEVERLGIERTWQAAAQADLALLVLDARQGIGAAEEAILTRLPPELRLIQVHNKIDLAGLEPSRTRVNTYESVFMSARNGEGVDLLEAAVLESVGTSTPSEDTIMARQRHIEALMQAHTHVESAAGKVSQPELLAEELRLAHQALGAITGEFSADNLLGEIFSRFCIGK